jgi:hypothetical protein
VIAQIPIYLAAVVSIAFGVRYLGGREFMPYHAIITGKSWEELDRGMQVAILGMLKVCGAGFLTYGVVLLWFLYPLSRGETWAAWAILSSALAMLLPILLITIWLRRFQPKAKTPVLPTAVVLGLVVVGALGSLA